MWSTTLTRELVGKNYSVYMDNFFSKENFQKDVELIHVTPSPEP